MDYIQSLGFSMPMFVSLVCLAMLVMFRHRNRDTTQRWLSSTIIGTFACAATTWFCIILYVVDYDGFVWANTLFLLALLIEQVLLYHFIFSITGAGRREKFRRLHYIIPCVLTVAMGVWSLATPYEVQYYIVESRGEPAPGHELYSRFFSSTVPLFVIYNILYPLLGLFRIRKFRREVVNYSADEQRSSVRWMYTLVFLIWLTLPIASIAFVTHYSVFFTSALTVFGAFLPIFQYLIICYNLISGNYVIIQPPESVEEAARKAKRIDRHWFETYVEQKKPFLDPKLRITDMCPELGTNRTYLSAFINREYGMNFSRYINRLRLDELDRIRLNPKRNNRPGIEMVLEAGFTSYRSYLRAKTDEDGRKVVRIFD